MQRVSLLTKMNNDLQDGSIQLRVSVVEDSKGRPQIGDIQAPQLSFSSISISTSEAKLAWLYNAVADLAHTQIQAVIIKEVSKQVSSPDFLQAVCSGRKYMLYKDLSGLL